MTFVPPGAAADLDWLSGPVHDSASEACGQSTSCTGDGRDGDFRDRSTVICPGPRSELVVEVITEDLFGSSLSIGAWQKRGNDLGLFDQAVCTQLSGGSGSRPRMRVPSVKELVGLLDLSRAGGVIPAGIQVSGGRIWAAVDGDSTYLLEPTTGVVTRAGFLSNLTGTQMLCLAESTSTGSTNIVPAFTEQTTGRVDDQFTRLRWATGLTATGKSWAQALTTCNTLEGACGRWRLPNYKELASLVPFDREATQTSVDRLSGAFWSSSPTPGSSTGALVWNFTATNGPLSESRAMTSTASVLCVQDL